MKIQLIPQFEDIFEELVLPEWLNGKEESFLNLNIGARDFNHVMETCRCFQSLYDIICSARLNLICACKNEYPELLDSDNPQLSHEWMRSQFLNNAILWYNAAFDLTLQPLWIYFKIYAKARHTLMLTTESFDKILEICRFKSLKKYGSEELGDELIQKLEIIDSYMQKKIRLWAITMKHRKKIEYVELSKKKHLVDVGGTFSIGKDENGKETIKMNEGEYNSSKTIIRIDMINTISTLISFHKELIQITKAIVAKINL